MKQILIKFIPRKWLRNPDDIADWRTIRGKNVIEVAHQNDPYYMLLIATHELWEQFLCEQEKITAKQVDEWDKNNKLMGDDPAAPYHLIHKKAEKIEKYAAKVLEIDWKKYSDSFSCQI